MIRFAHSTPRRYADFTRGVRSPLELSTIPRTAEAARIMEQLKTIPSPPPAKRTAR